MFLHCVSTRLAGDDIGMSRNHLPGSILPSPNISKPPLYKFAGMRCIPNWLDSLSTHDNGNVSVKPDRLNSPFEHCIADQSTFD